MHLSRKNGFRVFMHRRGFLSSDVKCDFYAVVTRHIILFTHLRDNGNGPNAQKWKMGCTKNNKAEKSRTHGLASFGNFPFLHTIQNQKAL